MKTIIFCGGGSAGHVIPNVTLISLLRKKAHCIYVGTNAIERSICQKNNIEFYEIQAPKLVRGSLFKNLELPFQMIKSKRQCLNLLKKLSPELVFCKGGYVCYPVASAAHSLHIPCFAHESDLTPGLTNKLIANKCKAVFTSFLPTASYFKNGVYTGSPINPDLYHFDKTYTKNLYFKNDKPTLLVFGGGSGSEAINQLIRRIAPLLCKRVNILHICGKGNLAQLELMGYEQREFINDMSLAYGCADFALARCGSNSAWELIGAKIPTLFIPLQNKRSRGDQVQNAKYFCSLGLCRVLNEKDMHENTLLAELDKLFKDSILKQKLNRYQVKFGTQEIVERIEEIFLT